MIKFDSVEEISFSLEKKLIKEVANQNFLVDEVFSDEEIISYINGNKDPEEVFDIRSLENWAEENGYTK